MSDDVVVIIPARYASQRFPGKPLVRILGTTMLERTCSRVRLCPRVSRILVATDDDRIAEAARACGVETVMTSTSCPTGTDRIAEVIDRHPELMDAAVVVNVQGDEPCLDPFFITKAVDALQAHPNNSIGTVVAPITDLKDLANTDIVKCVVSCKDQALYFSRQAIPGSKRQAQPIQGMIYWRHIGLYSFRPSFVRLFTQLPTTPLQRIEDIEVLRAMEHGYHVGVGYVERHVPDVNVPADISEVIAWIRNNQSSYSSWEGSSHP